VTLTEDAGAIVRGVAYQLAGSKQQQQQVIAALEEREKCARERTILMLSNCVHPWCT
jgi:cation transport regulator ChaC